MNDKSNLPISNILSPLEIRRYAKQIVLPEIGLEGQEKIKKAKVLVIGAGVKGTAVLQNLVTSGIGILGICDYNPVQENDLCGQFLYGNGDLGKQKAIISKQKLLEINPLVNFELHNVYLTEQNIDLIIKNYDLLIDTTDNFPSRYLISDAAIRLGKPTIFGSILDSKGFVSIFNYNGGPSFKCLYPAPLEETKNSQFGLISQVFLGSFIGSFIGNETLKVIIGAKSSLNGFLLQFDAINYSLSFKPIIKNPENFC
jgi:sulfur-carrier protein adenylyltransferase/sulfurtransferase